MIRLWRQRTDQAEIIRFIQGGAYPAIIYGVAP